MEKDKYVVFKYYSNQQSSLHPATRLKHDYVSSSEWDTLSRFTEKVAEVSSKREAIKAIEKLKLNR